MKTLFYPRLAWDGLRKNRRMVFPYILTCISMISMFYILVFLSSPKTVELLPRGGNNAVLIMTLGSYVLISKCSTETTIYARQYVAAYIIVSL